MAALTADRTVTTFQWDPTTGIHRTFPVAASTVIYKGGFVGLNAAGYLVMYAAPTVGTSIVGGHRFVGIALDHIASQTAAGDASCDVLVKGFFQHALGSAAIADQGKPVFASDDNTLTLASLGNAYVGTIERLVSSGVVIVAMDAYDFGCGTSPGLVVGMSPIIASAAANKVTVIHKSQNPNGLLIIHAFGICTTDFGGAVVYTLKDTAGTTTGITFTGAATTDANEVIAPAANTTSFAATDSAVVMVPAGLGVDVEVTTTQATGAAKFMVIAAPIA